jgi:CheY-like chemotaxis protein
MARRSKILLISGAQATVPLWAQDLRVIPETNPGNALKRWAETGPDVIVFDAGPEALPSLDEVRRLRQEAILPILMLCSNREESFLLEAYAAGVDECVLKPISPALLQAKIRAWLRRSWSLPANLLDALTVGDTNLIPSERSLVLHGGQPIPLGADHSAGGQCRGGPLDQQPDAQSERLDLQLFQRGSTRYDHHRVDQNQRGIDRHQQRLSIGDTDPPTTMTGGGACSAARSY